MFLDKYFGFAAGHFLHFKVGIFNANAAEQPNLGPAMVQGTAGVRAPSALLATSHGFCSWGNPQSCWSVGWRQKSSEEFAQGGARVKPFLVPNGDGEL